MARFLAFAMLLVFGLFGLLSFSGGAAGQTTVTVNSTITVSQTSTTTLFSTVTSTKVIRISTTSNLTLTTTSTTFSYATSNMTVLEFITLTVTGPASATINHTVLATTTRTQTSFSTESLTKTITSTLVTSKTVSSNGSGFDITDIAIVASFAGLIGLVAGYVTLPGVKKRRTPSYYGTSKFNTGGVADAGKSTGQAPVKDAKGVSDEGAKGSTTGGGAPADAQNAGALEAKFCQYCGTRIPLHQTSCPMFKDF